MRIVMMSVVLTILACAGDPVQDPESAYDFSVTNILTFKDNADMAAYLSHPVANGFVSLEDVYRRAVDELGEARTADDHARLLNEYQDVVSLADDSYVPRLRNSAYRKIANRDRLYMSGKYVHKIIDDTYIVFTDPANIRALLKIESVSSLDASVFNVARYQEAAARPAGGASVLASCGNDLRKDYFDNHSNCRNDRRAWVRAFANFLVSGFDYTPAVISEAWAELRTGTFCNWKQYQNILHTKNCSFTVAATINNATQSFSKTTTDLSSSNPYDGTSDEWQHFIWGGDSGTAPVGPAIHWIDGPTPSIEFSAIHLESSSQGVGADHEDHWAVLDCQ